MIDKILFLNIRSFNTQDSFEILIKLENGNHYSCIALMEVKSDILKVKIRYTKSSYILCNIRVKDTCKFKILDKLFEIHE